MTVTYTGYTTPRLDLSAAFSEYMFSPDMFIGTQIYAALPVSRKSGVISLMPKEGILRAGDNVKRKPRSGYERGDVDVEEFSYECIERGHETPLDYSEINEYSPAFQVERAAAQRSLFKVLHDQELDLATVILDGTTTYTVANGRRTDVSTAWSTTSSDIIGDVQTAKEAVRSRTGQEPNTFAFGGGVVPFLMANSGLRDAIKYTQMATLDALKNALAALLGFEKILIGKGAYNSAAKGQTFSGTDHWGSGWAVVANTANAGDPVNTPCVGRTAMWVTDTPTDSALIEQYEDPQTRSTVLRARSFADEIEIDPDQQQLLDIAG